MGTPRRYGYIQKLCTLRAHDSTLSKEDVIFNPDSFVELDVKAGDLIAIVAVRDDKPSNDKKRARPETQHDSPDDLTRHRLGFTPVVYDEAGRPLAAVKEADNSRTYVFLLPESSAQTRKPQDVAISISATVANIFGFRNRMQVLVSIADEAVHAASHVEITFRDQYLSRADMWRMAVTELSQRTVYKDQKVVFLDTIKATVKTIYHHGEKRKAGYFGPSTKTIFRSESARYIIFIQMSLEMWQFDVEGGGEIMFNKVINGFLPELFKNWASIRARHRISFVLFSRVEYDDAGSRTALDTGTTSGYRAGTRDFYRVVVTDVSSGDWISILQQLKREFRTFLKDITLQKAPSRKNDAAGGFEGSAVDADYAIVGKPSPAAKGNILEAINLALVQFSEDHIDRDLSRTGISVTIITAGSGVYEVDYTLLKHTTETLIGSGIGIDLVCLAPMPLHSVPLFKYRNPRLAEDISPVHPNSSSSMENTPRAQHTGLSFVSERLSDLERTESVLSRLEPDIFSGDWSYAVPHWVDVSFWKGAVEENKPDVLRGEHGLHQSLQSLSANKNFTLRCVLYELEMVGFMENEMTNIAITLMHEHPLHPWRKLRHRITGRPKDQIDRSGLRKLDEDWMEEYDEDVFRSADAQIVHEEAAKRIFKAGLADRNIAARTIHDNDSQVDVQRTKASSGSFIADLRPLTRLSSHQMTAQRAPSIMSVASNNDKTSIFFKSGAPARKISYGPSTVAAPQETKVDGKAEAATRTAAISHDNGSKKPPAASYFNTFRAMFAKSSDVTSAPTQSADTKLSSIDLNTKAEASETAKHPSDPIAIGVVTTTRQKYHSRASSTEAKLGSIDTVRAASLSLQKHSLSRSSRVDGSGAILYVASNTRRGSKRPDRSSVADGPKQTQTFSPLRSIAPWLVLVNPSNPNKNPSNLDHRFRRWHHIFPKPLRLSVMKWKSLSSPASVPLTNDFFPSARELANEYHESTYTVIQSTDEEIIDEDHKDGKEFLMRRLIAFRLAKGFQLIVGSALSEFLGTVGVDHANIFDKNYMAPNGSTIFMSMGNTIHQLLSSAPNEVEIRRFSRKPVTDVIAVEGSDPLEYTPYIRPALAATYEPRVIKLQKSGPDYNWNYIDSFLAGYQDQRLSENLRFWRARFVFIPIDIPQNFHLPMQTRIEDSEEEIRLEGIRKLTGMWQRHRILEPDGRGFASSRRRQDRNPLMIDYQTRDPSAVVAAGSSGLLLADGDSGGFIFSETERYSTQNIDLHRLSNDLQGDKGITMIDRRWHWKLYHNCFIAFDLVSWLLDRFRDIESREDAVNLGKELMSKGLFQHVSKKHEFRDGNFFFHISAEYRLSRSDSKGWFASRRSGQMSIPSTPNPDVHRSNHQADTLRLRPQTSSSSETSLDEKVAASKERGRRKVMLSNVMRYNVDPKKQSFRAEIINLHYDRLHSPDNCYHFRIDWMNTTAKFIDDAVSQWATHGRKFGLKLVEIPIGEAATISGKFPFRGPFIIKLALLPPATSPQEPAEFDPSSYRDQSADPVMYHKAILRKLNFVLDVESASSFPEEVEVAYSWGENDYKMTQYIHRSGTTIAQITDEGHFQLLANRLFNNRSVLIRETSKFERKEVFDIRSNAKRLVASPGASPSLKALPEQQLDADPKTVTAEQVKEMVEAFCSDVDKLKTFYEEVNKPIASPSPATASTFLDTPVPSLRLPPRVTRDATTSPTTKALNGI